MTRRPSLSRRLCAPLVCGALLAVPPAGHAETPDAESGKVKTGQFETGQFETGQLETGDFEAGHAGSGLAETGRLIVGLAPDTALAAAWEDSAEGSAEVAEESALAGALEDLVGMPIRDIKLGSGRTVNFAPDWQAMGGVAQGGHVLVTLGDVRVADTLAARLDPVGRSDGGAALELDPARTIAAVAEWLATLDGVAYAQPDMTQTID